MFDTKKVMLDNGEQYINQKEEILNAFLHHSMENLKALRESSIFKRFLETADNHEETCSLFITFVKANDDYMQLRYIDKNGDEIIRVDKKEAEHDEVVINHNLQNKSNRYYFFESISKKDSEVWYSALDLNVENKKVQIPYVPTIRTILPMVKNGEFQGILIVNHFARKILKDVTESVIFKTILVDESGNFIHHYENDKNWSAYKDKGFQLKDEFPTSFDEILNNEIFRNNEFISKKLNVPLYDNIYLINKVNEKYLKEEHNKSFERNIIQFMVFSFLSVLFTIIIIRLFGNIFNDFNEQKEINDRLELASSISNIGFWELDTKTEIINISKGSLEIFGIKDSTLRFDQFLALKDEGNRIEFYREFLDSVEEKREYFAEYKIVIKEETKVIQEKGKHFFNKEGIHIKTVGSIVDITEKYLAQKLNEKIAKQAKEFKKLFDRFDENVIASTTDLRGVITYTSEAFCKISGFSKEELIGSPQNIVRHPETPSEVFKELWKTIQNGEVWTGEIKNKTKNGGIYWVHAIIYPEFNDKDEIIGFSAIRHDITAKKEIEHINQKTQSSIEFASFIQHSLLPSKESLRACVKDKFVIWEPKDTIGGDIYLLEKPRGEDECLLIVIDCTGHGVPGAFVTMLVKAIERQIIQIIKSNPLMEIEPSWVLQFYNQTMKRILNQKDRALASNVGFDGGVLYYNKRNKIVKFAGASNSLLYATNEGLQLIKGDRYSIGYKNSSDEYLLKNHEIKVEDGMKFYLFTDGYTDQIGGEKGFPFGRRRFVEILNKNLDKPMIEQKQELLDELTAYQKDYERIDDITVIGLEI